MTDGTTSNRYTILGRLAGGGMADIFVAKSTSMGDVERHVVLKRVLPALGRDEAFAKMFLDEARLAAQLHHPNIAQVLDVGILAGSYFFTMEYVHGKDVRALLSHLAKAQRQLPINIAIHIAVGALAALHHAHEHTNEANESLGVVHRDVSPSNIIVSFEGAVKLVDFGVAKAAQRSTETRVGTIKGKIAYLSPEQCKHEPIDRRSDIFSLGILFHEMLTGRRLYRFESDFETMNAIVKGPVAAPSLARADVSPELDAIVAKALAKHPDERFATAAEMIEALENLAARERHQMSTRGLGKLMRELFGDVPLPWKNPTFADSKVITITVDSIADGIHTPDSADLVLVEQLERAPALPQRARTMANLPAFAALPALPLPPAPRRRRRWPIVAAVVATLFVVVITHHRAPPRPPEAKPIVAARTVDAPVTRTIVDAPKPPDWIGVLQRCVATTTLSDDERILCAVAACNAGRRALVLDYVAEVPATARPQIERACRSSGIALREPSRELSREPSRIVRRQPARVVPAAAPPAAAPQVDPCETDPLACQK